MSEKELYSHFACVLQVDDIQASIAFYTAQLSFTCSFTWNEPVDYAVLKRGTISVHLSQASRPIVLPDGISMYIFVHDVHAVYRECLDKGVPISSPLALRDYGMEDFDVHDPDGYQISFGKG